MNQYHLLISHQLIARLTMTRSFFILSCALFGMWCSKVNAQESALTRLDSIAFFEGAKEKNALLIDVRTKTEFKQGHLKGAKQVDFLQPEKFESFFKRKDTLEPVYLYCRSGNRSQKAAKYLESIGFKKIYDLKGGYMGLQRK